MLPGGGGNVPDGYSCRRSSLQSVPQDWRRLPNLVKIMSTSNLGRGWRMDIRANFIAGEWVASTDAVENVSPSDTNDVIGHYAIAESRHVEQAVAAADDAFEAYSTFPIQQRSDFLEKIAAELIERGVEIGTLLSREEGKTLAEGIAEVRRAGHIFRFYAGEALRICGANSASVRPGVHVELRREPIGPIAVITPWNFPIAIPAWKIAAALAYGNTVVFKPAELVCGSAWCLSEIIARSGFPAGVFNLVMGSGRTVGNALVEAPTIKGVSFTGSENTGSGIAQACAARNARVQLEMGGKNPLVVLDDADLQRAISIAVDGAFFSTGQRCTATSRIILTEGIHDQFLVRLREAARSLKVGHALDQATEMGPVVDERQLEQNLRYLRIGREEGATLHGGQILEREHTGYYLSPAVFSETTNDMRICQEEIFGPVVCVLTVRDYEEALATANDTKYGLSSGICTRSLKHAEHFKRSSAAGLVTVNLPTAGIDYHVPFGGRKASSYGPRELGNSAMEFFTATKTCYTSSD